MTNDKWNKINSIGYHVGQAVQIPEEKTDFLNMLESSGVDTEIAKEVALQLEHAENEDKGNIIFIFTEGDYVVTAIHVPAESLNGENGPILMRGGGDKSIIAAFSREFIISKLEKVENEANNPGLHIATDAQWIDELEKMAELVKIQMETSPPESWEELLGDI
jgi:hypothetical protein